MERTRHSQFKPSPSQKGGFVSRSAVLSLFLHGAVLGLALWVRPADPPPEIIVPTVDLVADAAAPEATEAAPSGPSLPASTPAAAAPSDPAPPEPRTTPVHRATPASAQKPRAHRATPAPPAPAALEKAADVEPAPPSAAASASSDGAAGAPAAPSAAPATAAEASGGGSGDRTEPAGAPGDVLNAYLAEIRRKIQRALVYPAAARRLGLTGRVDLAFRIESDGTVPADGLRVVGGSDEDLLREGAIATIRDVGGFRPPPGGSLHLVVPVVFTLIGPR